MLPFLATLGKVYSVNNCSSVLIYLIDKETTQPFA